jgi:hypothetical protein
MNVRAPTEAELAKLAPPGVYLRRVPIVNCVNKFPAEERMAKMRAASARNLPDMIELEMCEAGSEGVIIGGGPSADEYIEKIKGFCNSGRYCVIAIERMLPWCLAHDMEPDYVIALDANLDVIEALQPPLPEVRYLIAMQCHPEVFNRVAHIAGVFTFQTPQRELDEDDTAIERRGMTLNSGGSVVLGAMSAAMALGMKSLHVFGFDCHLGNGGYAKKIAGVGEQIEKITLRIDDRDFSTTLPYLAFAQQFFTLLQFARDDELLDAVKIYGDSMISAMSKEDIRG